MNIPDQNIFTTPEGEFTLNRYPQQGSRGKSATLRAWDAADEYLLQHLAELTLPVQQSGKQPKLLIVNDSFGGLCIPLGQYQPVVMTDSYLTVQAISLNSDRNGLEADAITIIDSLQDPSEVMQGSADIVIVKIPKSLAMLEDQLHRIRPVVAESTTIVAAAMTKNIHTSTMATFEKVLGPTKTSLARKKARLIFCDFDKDQAVTENPYPQKVNTGYQLDGEDIEVLNHASVFSREKLDIGSRLFLENMPTDERYGVIADLGCGNGILGLIAAIKNPQAAMIFTDESYMAVESAIANFMAVFAESREAEFLQTDCLQGVAENSVSLVLCNPPFHQNNAINDDVAWQMFTESKTALKNKGELWVIGNRHLAYHAKLKHLFGACETVASNKKFTLLKATKNI